MTRAAKHLLSRSWNELHLNPVGRHTCALFKIDRMVPFEDAPLDSIRKLQAKLALLQKAESQTNPLALTLNHNGNEELSPPGPSGQTNRIEQ